MIKSSVIHILGISLLIFVCIISSSAKSQDKVISPEQSSEIIEKIYAKYAPVYKKYQGSESTRMVDIEEYDPATNAMINRSSVSLIRKDYFYKKADIIVLKYEKNDKPMKTSDYKSREENPGPPVLDENGKNQYLTKITRRTTILNQECYHMTVVPKNKSPKHFEGSIYFSCNNLKLVFIEGTTAEIAYPLKEFSMKMYFDHINDLPVLRTGSFIMRVYVPMLQPDRRFIINIKAHNNKPL